MSIKTEIIDFMAKWNVTQSELSKMAGVKQPGISYVINGKRKGFHNSNADKIRKVMADYEREQKCQNDG